MDVTGPNMTCNRMSEIPFTKQDTKTLDVVAGSAIGTFTSCKDSGRFLIQAIFRTSYTK